MRWPGHDPEPEWLFWLAIEAMVLILIWLLGTNARA